MLTGTVSGSNDDAVVDVSLFPAMTPANSRPGMVVHTAQLTPAPVAEDGTFTVFADPAQLGGYVDQWGRMDVTATITDGSHIGRYRESTIAPAALTHAIEKVATGTERSRATTARRLRPYELNQHGREWTSAAGVPALNADLNTGLVTETLGNPSTAPTQVAAPESSALPARFATGTVSQVDQHRIELGTAAQAAVTMRSLTARLDGESEARHPCRKTFGKKHLGKRERFMPIVNWAGAPITAHQREGNSHTLGVAIKLSGKDWTGGTGTTRTVSTTMSDTLSDQVNKWMRNRVNYQDVKYEGLCDYPGARTERVPTGLHSMLIKPVVKPALPYMKKPAGCQVRGPGYDHTHTTTSNMTVSGGVDVGPVNVSAQSGWDSETSWTVSIDKKSKECYSNEAGVMHSRYVHYRPKKRRTEPCGRTDTQDSRSPHGRC